MLKLLFNVRFSAWTSSFTDTMLDYLRTLDNFSVSTDATIGSISFQVMYLLSDPISSSYSNGTPDTNDWIVTVYTSGGTSNFPFSPIASETIASGAITETLAGTTNYGSSTVDFYNDSFVLPTPISIQGGQTYYLSIFSDNGGSSNLWLWMSGSGGDGASWQYNGYPNATTTIPDDRAFTLSSVPEPSGLILGLIATASLTGYLDLRSRLRGRVISSDASVRGVPR